MVLIIEKWASRWFSIQGRLKDYLVTDAKLDSIHIM